jgi:UDP-glucose 4-epimerase
MRILVTGGSGYVGSHAVRELVAAGHEVRIYDNFSTGRRKLSDGFDVVEGDIADVEKVTRCLQGMDAVMHFAASAYVGESVQNPRKYFANNVESGLKLLDAVLASSVRKFIFSSTCATYGEPRELPVAETCPQRPVNPYGASKLFLEHALSAYGEANSLRFAILRYFNAAGAHSSGTIGELHEPETHLIPLALKAASGTKPPLTIFGSDLDTPDGTCVRDFVHVSDLGSAHVMALEYLNDGGSSVRLNLGTGIGTSILQLLAAVKSVTGREVPYRLADARAGDPPILYADPRKAEEILGWRTKRGLEDIISTAWNWENNLAANDGVADFWRYPSVPVWTADGTLDAVRLLDQSSLAPCKPLQIVESPG